jgi:hypothetical protein
MKELMALAARPAHDLSGSEEDVAAAGLASYRLFQRETSLEMRQVYG